MENSAKRSLRPTVRDICSWLIFRRSSAASSQAAAEAAERGPYNLPFSFAPPSPRVLIVGSGTGNDVAAAVRHESVLVDAVEIDHGILALGKAHPSAPQLSVHVTDARAYEKRGPW